MAWLLAFSPFVAFLVGEHLLGVVPALCAGCAVAVALLVRGRLRGAREVNELEAGTALLFGALAVCASLVTDVAWSVGLVRLVVDGSLMLLVLAGAAVGRPFTLAIARARVTPERADTPAFLRLNRLVAVVWAGAFGVLAIADVVLILQPSWPLAIPIAISAGGLVGAFRITQKLTSVSARGACARP
ncbi:hypothetical protein [Scleromatobacter humisilvae]|uniref:Intracellular septation protein A n=1 Tax=Scleromatobacter humisilvae TaxID=2897159 RepID=A0A9X1YMW4_9BURK|nr:hypothetical protein [Scleromatobacter humisilvae]MCK9688707.1 hypothetical protein [Scleromatobacter humisilvae]